MWIYANIGWFFFSKIVCDFIRNSTKNLDESPLVIDYIINDQKSGKVSELNARKKLNDLKIEVIYFSNYKIILFFIFIFILIRLL
jgi:hypothetical protein